MDAVIIVEGHNDRIHLRKFITDEIEILCTNGTLNSQRLEALIHQIDQKQVIIFTDNDSAGKKIRKILADVFPDAEHLYTKKGYAGVEGTPDEHILSQLEKAELDDYILK
ncbi:toprim domain-containing protein [Chengkuizengella axinellae]|uniref:Toprim domain-containing protein n=1 Tax=Chengkuizengella axinellae TaxID=3064388 RepID=A0ABT9IT81_9BACL|nr:toprim domain-containing protein [Chengkuizengella sp. 2205SS18-9]MDP5272543.1 toprim domain-containing protein [Chengkuizengella sp. 2205SS18-9]